LIAGVGVGVTVGEEELVSDELVTDTALRELDVLVLVLGFALEWELVNDDDAVLDCVVEELGLELLAATLEVDDFEDDNDAERLELDDALELVRLVLVWTEETLLTDTEVDVEDFEELNTDPLLEDVVPDVPFLIYTVSRLPAPQYSY